MRKNIAPAPPDTASRRHCRWRGNLARPYGLLRCRVILEIAETL